MKQTSVGNITMMYTVGIILSSAWLICTGITPFYFYTRLPQFITLSYLDMYRIIVEPRLWGALSISCGALSLACLLSKHASNRNGLLKIAAGLTGAVAVTYFATQIVTIINRYLVYYKHGIRSTLNCHTASIYLEKTFRVLFVVAVICLCIHLFRPFIHSRLKKALCLLPIIFQPVALFAMYVVQEYPKSSVLLVLLFSTLLQMSARIMVFIFLIVQK